MPRASRSKAKPKTKTPKKTATKAKAKKRLPKLEEPVVVEGIAPAPSTETIAHEAYLIWLAKGCPADQDMQNWLEAEQHLAASA